MSLLDRLKAQIAQDGPIAVPEFFTRCLHDPRDGYYATRPDLGAGGDFITAPLVSQMFGELIGLWAIETWTRMGRPAPFHLVEMGPGDGTLMSDLLRAAWVAPDFLEAADPWLVEVSEPLKAKQADHLGDRPRWASRLHEVPAGAPMILIANELLDCLPARQFVRTKDGWAERVGSWRSGYAPLILPLEGEVPAHRTVGEVLLTRPLPPPTLRVTSPLRGRISRSARSSRPPPRKPPSPQTSPIVS